MSDGDTNPDRKEKPDDKDARVRGAIGWWRRITDDTIGDPGALARLRRATRPVEAWAEPETARLYRALGFKSEQREYYAEAAAILAMTLAHVRENKGRRLGVALGAGDPPVMHPLRLRRLASARNTAEILRGFREAIALLKGEAPVGDLTECVLDWTDRNRSEGRRSRFLFDYHGAQPPDEAAPSPDESPAEATS
ncbi:MAG: type I-E CRISPR-associated protein Cse2/CasB [Beijerinckiaceae bacterium]